MNREDHDAPPEGCQDSASPKLLMKFGLIGAGVIFVLWCVTALTLIMVFGKPDSAGTFGDLFGSINALFSGLAFLGVILAIFLQREELIEQRREIRASREAHQKSAAALADQLRNDEVRTKLESINLAIDALQRLADNTADKRTIADQDRHKRYVAELQKFEEQLFELVQLQLEKTDDE